MRRKGQAPFTRHVIDTKQTPTTTTNLEKNLYTNNDPLYNTMQRELADGMNHITKTIMQARIGANGDNNGGGIVGFNSDNGIGIGDNDLMNTNTGELQIYRENIPMRPLMVNGTGQNGSRKIISGVEGKLSFE